jgi:amino acid adenylation domain-containing protein
MNSEVIQGFQLSPQQKHLWHLQQSGDMPYRSLCAVEINGILNIDTLRNALQAVIERHQILRTSFRCLPGMTMPLQVIGDRSIISIQNHDLSSMEDQQQNAVTALFESALQQTIDFEKSSLLQVSLVKLSATNYILLLNLPALCADKISLQNLAKEISIIYNASGRNEELLEEAVQYILFSEWQHELLQSEEAVIGKQYWRQNDITPIFSLKLPRENQHDEKSRFAPQTLTQIIDPELAAKFSSLVAELDTAENIFLMSCWQILLWRLTGMTSIIIGTACDGRPDEEFEETIGLFAKYVPLYCSLDSGLKFCDLISTVALAQSRADGWQECFNWEEVLGSDTDVAAVPFLPFCFDFTEQFPKSADVTFSLFQQYACIDRFKVKLSFIRRDDGLIAEFHYDANLFSQTDIEQLASQYQKLLTSVIENPQVAIDECDILSDVERQLLLVDFNNTQIDFPLDKCLHQLFSEQVNRTPDNIAVVYEQQYLTYSSLNQSANQLAHHLQKLGVGADVLVGICIERSLEMVIALLGVLKAGGAYVPIDPMYPEDRVAFMLEDAQTPVLLTQQRLLGIFPNYQGQIICLDADWETIAYESAVNPICDVTTDNLAYVIYTSGSTGKPKGAMLPHRAICNHMLWMQADFPLTETDKVLQKTPFSFDASIWEFYAPLLVGAQLALARPGGHHDSDYLIQTIVEQKITTLQVVPTLLRMLLENQQIANCQSLKNVFCGGEPLTFELQKRFFTHLNAKLHNLYGPTETCIDATYWTCKPGLNQQIVPIGHPIANTQAYILDNQLQPVPVGVCGELYIAGAGLAKGYLNRKELTSQKFIPNHLSNKAGALMYKTGDLACFLPDGSIEYLGRIDHQVKIRGFRIELGEIEALLAQHPQVRLVTVIAREDEPGNPRLVAYIVPQPEGTLKESELHRFLKEQLPEYMVPSAFVMLDTLPLTPNGKLDRRALKAPNTNRNTIDAGYLPPRDAIELQLAQIWEKVLNIQPVGVRENFFNLGGHSLLAVRLIAQIQQQLGKNLPLATLFQNPTIAQMADVVRQESESLWSPLVAIQPNGSKPPFFCVPGAGGNVLYFYHLARYLGSDQPFYGLQALGLDGESQPHTSVADIAAYYIQAIQTIQPEGPYYLGGHSFGGQVAFEIAQQLQNLGHKVALVAIFDTPAPLLGILPERLDWDGATWLVYLAQIISRLCSKTLQVSYEELQPLNSDEQLHYFKEKLTMVDLLPPEVGITQVRGLVQVFQANKQTRYLPENIYPTRIALFRASEVHPEDAASDEIDDTMLPSDAAWGWSEFSSHPVDVHFVPGDHLSMIVGPKAEVLATHLKTSIEQAVANVKE